MSQCSFCGKEITVGTGLSVFDNKGVVTRFCSRKCERNIALGRKPVALKWTVKGGKQGK